MKVRDVVYTCFVCGFVMVRPQYNIKYDNGRVQKKLESKEGICCGKKMKRTEEK